jgi:hypothetical protein
MTPEKLARSVEGFLLEAGDAVVVEDGQIIFDLANARYSISTQQNKCLLHLWSDERNTVRRVLDSQRKNGVLCLSVQKFGQPQPNQIEICHERDRRTASTRKVQRSVYQRLLGRTLQRHFPKYKIERLSSAMDLERSFGPIYTRALIRKGQSAFAVLGVNEEESQASVDAALTFGLLWLDLCREREAGRSVIEGLHLFLPQGRSGVVRARAAHLDHAMAKFALFELEEHDGVAHEFDARDTGNISTRLVSCVDAAGVLRRFSASVQRIREIVPDCDIVVRDPTEICFRLNGLEFACARLRLVPGSFHQQQDVTFGTGRFETALSEETAPRFSELMARLRDARRANAVGRDVLWRMQPERWLESLIVRNVSRLDAQLDSGHVYSQVPAFAASDRAMIDVLTCTRSGRLAVIEVKADEDIHLPMQGLDYWARVKWHHERGEFQTFGYFAGKQLSPEPPRLVLVSPALRIHPATDTLLRYLDPQIEWTLVGVDENWRSGVNVVFRKRPDIKP